MNMPEPGLQWEADITPFLSAVTAVAVFFIGVKVVRMLISDERAVINDGSKAHSWRSTTILQGVQNDL